MDSDEKLHLDLKKMLEEQHGRELSTEEVDQAARDFEAFVTISARLCQEEFRMQEMLKENPKGFHSPKGGTCPICDSYCQEENSWYDKYGLKCMMCQLAINAKIIPGWVAQKKERWYSQFDLETYFNIRLKDLRVFLKHGILKARIVPGKGKKAHAMLFLLQDNKAVLPPKKLVKSRIVKTMHKGEEYFTSEEWYQFADEKQALSIAKYQIAHYLKELFSKPVKPGRFYWKGTSPLFTVKG